jgi:serine phosphatase RsbU (regulator of sigma subunit)
MQSKVLFVDDDANILSAFRRQLRKKIDIETVSSGAEGLEAIRRSGPFSVVVTDYSMPEMNGVEFLTRVREVAPETVRMLLTGSADLGTAVQAVNQGSVFRFLTKPCSPDDLMDALSSGIDEYRRACEENKFTQRTRRWLTQVGEVQQGLMPTAGPGIDGIDIAGRSVFCDQAGGDYYDYFVREAAGGPQVSIAVGDVSDHGMPSALLMTSARAFLRERASQPGGAAGIVSSVNRQLSRDVKTSGRFMTLFYAEFDSRSSSIRWVRAGHEPALLFDPDKGVLEELGGPGGLPLGVLEDAVYEAHQRRLEAGQIVAIGTDGIWEACNDAGLMFGKPLLHRTIQEHCRQTAAGIVEAVLEALQRFLSPLSLQDDATLVVLKVGS